jgi:hypothetical protein
MLLLLLTVSICSTMVCCFSHDRTCAPLYCVVLYTFWQKICVRLLLGNVNFTLILRFSKFVEISNTLKLKKNLVQIAEVLLHIAYLNLLSQKGNV